MLQATIIGNLGADAEVKNVNGSEFLTMRLAHTNKWTDANGKEHDTTTWVDVTMNGGYQNIIQFLRQGVKVYAIGNVELRVYSSQKDRCMKAGLTIRAQRVELCGGTSDSIPREIVTEDGLIHAVTKHYYCQDLAGSETVECFDRRMNKYQVTQGWVHEIARENPAEQQQQEVQQEVQQEEQPAQEAAQISERQSLNTKDNGTSGKRS